MSLPKLSDYSLLEKIGTGSYATVYRAFKRDKSREIVAIKCIKKLSLSQSRIDDILMEINLLKILKYEHIVEMKDFFWDEGNIYIVMEYCDGGDLSKFIKRKHKLPENICRRFLQQLALALKYLRSHNVCHVDLKPQNLLLVRKPRLILKVGDFGLAQNMSDSDKKFNIRGSPLYMAPEILLQQKYDPRVDLWSVGVIMYECLFSKAPYSSSSFQELAEKIKEKRPIEIPKGCHVSNECKNLLMSLLKHNPEERITFEEFFDNEFLDLEHAPTSENYEKAVTLIQKAVEMDTKDNKEEAYNLYCDALKYFIPLLTNETDLKRKEILRSRVYDYITRAEKLKSVAETGSNDNTSCLREKNLQSTIPPSRNVLSPEQAAHLGYFELRTLSKSTINMYDGLEIGEVAEQYLAEGNYALALEKLQSCLNVLVPMLGREPPGRRRDLLHKQVQQWLKEAEGIKNLTAKVMDNESTPKSLRTSEQCLVQ